MKHHKRLWFCDDCSHLRTFPFNQNESQVQDKFVWSKAGVQGATVSFFSAAAYFNVGAIWKLSFKPRLTPMAAFLSGSRSFVSDFILYSH